LVVGVPYSIERFLLYGVSSRLRRLAARASDEVGTSSKRRTKEISS
jgi:hypothetical protein